jgi:hypothetical protein
VRDRDGGVVQRLTLKVRDLPPWADQPDGDVGTALVGLVEGALQRGGAPPAAVVLRPERTELVLLTPAVGAAAPFHRFMAGLTRSDVADASAAVAVGFIGTVRSLAVGDRPGPDQPVAVVFVEWEDCRWWFWRASLAPDLKTVRPGSEVVVSALDGDRMPDRLGRWWSLGRRLGMTVTLQREAPRGEWEN